jgi:hypothetical protein
LAVTRPPRGLWAELARNDHLLTPRFVSAVLVYLFLALSYAQVEVKNDGLTYYNFMRRLVGEHVAGYAYQFGSVIWNLPFYGLGRLLSTVLGSGSIGNSPIGELSIVAAATVAVIVIFCVGWQLIRELGLPGGPGTLLLTTFGTPLFYYAIFAPGYKHVVDTVFATILAFLMRRASKRPMNRRLTCAIGLLIACLINVRYADAAFLVGALWIFLRRKEFTHAYLMTVVSFAGAGLILLVPALRGIPYGLPPGTATAGVTVVQHDHTDRQLAASTAPRIVSPPLASADVMNGVKFDPVAPVKMLFSLKRGLFIWTPLTAFGVLGFLLLFRRDEDHRLFLGGLGLSALALLLVHAAWGSFWDGGYSFSERFLTALFPLFALGIAELLRRTRMLVAPLLVLCVAWSCWISLYHWYGYDHVSEADGVGRFIQLYEPGGGESLPEFWHVRVTGKIESRWSAYAHWVSRW